MAVTPKAVMLLLSVMMPGEQPDISHHERMKSLDECWTAAKEFTEKGVPDSLRAQGAVGLRAGCAYVEMPSSAE